MGFCRIEREDSDFAELLPQLLCVDCFGHPNVPPQGFVQLKLNLNTAVVMWIASSFLLAMTG